MYLVYGSQAVKDMHGLLFLQKTSKIVHLADSQWVINLWVWLTGQVIFYYARLNGTELVSVIRTREVAANQGVLKYYPE